MSKKYFVEDFELDEVAAEIAYRQSLILRGLSQGAHPLQLLWYTGSKEYKPELLDDTEPTFHMDEAETPMQIAARMGVFAQPAQSEVVSMPTVSVDASDDLDFGPDFQGRIHSP